MNNKFASMLISPDDSSVLLAYSMLDCFDADELYDGIMEIYDNIPTRFKKDKGLKGHVFYNDLVFASKPGKYGSRILYIKNAMGDIAIRVIFSGIWARDERGFFAENHRMVGKKIIRESPTFKQDLIDALTK